MSSATGIPTTTTRLTVAACIGCGARSRAGACADGCADVPLDLIDAGHVDALAAHVRALERRVHALRALSAQPRAGLPALRERARAALRTPAPAREHDAPIVEAWGCPDCGRVDAPQPCLGVCQRRPLLMAGADEYRRLARAADELAAEERELARRARLVANVRARPGHEAATAEALRALLATGGVQPSAPRSTSGMISPATSGATVTSSSPPSVWTTRRS